MVWLIHSGATMLIAIRSLVQIWLGSLVKF